MKPGADNHSRPMDSAAMNSHANSAAPNLAEPTADELRAIADELRAIIDAYYEVAEDLDRTSEIASWVNGQGYCAVCSRALQRCACNRTTRPLAIHMAAASEEDELKTRCDDLRSIIGALHALLAGDHNSNCAIHETLRENGFCSLCLRSRTRCDCENSDEGDETAKPIQS